MNVTIISSQCCTEFSASAVEQGKMGKNEKERGESDCWQMTSLEGPKESKEALVINNKIK